MNALYEGKTYNYMWGWYDVQHVIEELHRSYITVSTSITTPQGTTYQFMEEVAYLTLEKYEQNISNMLLVIAKEQVLKHLLSTVTLEFTCGEVIYTASCGQSKYILCEESPLEANFSSSRQSRILLREMEKIAPLLDWEIV